MKKATNTIPPFTLPDDVSTVQDLLAYLRSSDEELATLQQTSGIMIRRSVLHSIIPLVEMVVLKSETHTK